MWPLGGTSSEKLSARRADLGEIMNVEAESTVVEPTISIALVTGDSLHTHAQCTQTSSHQSLMN